MATDVIMPSLGFDMTEGKLLRWLVREGDRIEKGQPIAEIETEKANVEIEAAASGVLTRIVVEPGRTVPVGSVIGVIGEPGERTAEPAAAPAPAPPRAPAAAEAKTGEEAKAGEGVGEGGEAEVAEEAGKGKEAEAPERRIKASPVARRMAEEAGIDLSGIRGTGPGGRIMERDVQAAAAAKPPPTKPPPAAKPPPTKPPPPEKPSPPLAGAAPGAPGSMSRMRQAIARRMTESKATAPHFYATVDIAMDEAMRMRDQLNALASDEDKVSVNDLIVAAAARTLTRFPGLNASYRDGAVTAHPHINIGIAVALPDGLIPPVLRDADKKGLKGIAAESKALGERARAGRLRADELGTGTFTVSNLGMFGVDEFIAIINPPEAAILAVGAVTRRPVVAGDEVRIGFRMKVTLSVDHRVADGAQAARFLQEFRKLLENPVGLLTG